MTPTVPVTVTLVSQDGVPYAGVTVRARLDVNEVYQGFVISDEAQAVTDATGVAILNCFPNAPTPTGLGTQGSTYSFRATIPGGRALNVQARVPNAPCRLENILVNDTAVSLDAAQLAVLQAQASATSATTSATNAANSAATAQAAQTAALATANATMWVSGTNYALGANVISPIDFLTYRRKVAGAGVTDPSLDTANWELLTISKGRLLNIRVFTASGTYTPTAGTQSVEVEIQAPGGGSGGTPATGAGQAAISAPGGAGSWGRGRFTSGFSGVTVTVGAAGAAGAAGANPGGAGGTTSFGALMSCPGGNGGGAGTLITTFPNNSGITAQTSAPSGANIVSSVGASGSQVLIAGVPYANGLQPTLSVFGYTYGRGAQGAYAGASSAAAGGFNGGLGIVIVKEYA